jgi:HK97 family phage prohead protease
MSSRLETRASGRIELREMGDGALTFEGHASVVEVPYPVQGFTETIKRGAFKRALGEQPDVVLLVNHDGLPLARTTSGNLVLTEDARGLHVMASLDRSDPDVQAIEPKMRRGDLTEMSFAFQATRQKWSAAKDEREIMEVKLHRGDVSLVARAASPSATGTLRAQDLTLEQRARIVERIGNRVCGPCYVPDLGEIARGHATIAVPVPIRSYVEEARARRAKLLWSGERPSVVATAATSPFGSQWNIGSAADVESAVLDVKLGAAKGKEAQVKAWIRKRAEDLNATGLIPTSWGASRSRAGAGRYSVERAKAARARARRAHPGSETSVEGEEDTPRYTPAEVGALGRRGLAFKKKDGTYGWPVVDRRDLLNAVKDWLRAAPFPESTAVKEYVKTRARLLRFEELLPASWQSKANPGLHPKEKARLG